MDNIYIVSIFSFFFNTTLASCMDVDEIPKTTSESQIQSNSWKATPLPKKERKKKVYFFPIMPLWVKTDRFFLFALTFTDFVMITRD